MKHVCILCFSLRYVRHVNLKNSSPDRMHLNMFNTLHLNLQNPLKIQVLLETCVFKSKIRGFQTQPSKNSRFVQVKFDLSLVLAPRASNIHSACKKVLEHRRLFLSQTRGVVFCQTGTDSKSFGKTPSTSVQHSLGQLDATFSLASDLFSFSQLPFC